MGTFNYQHVGRFRRTGSIGAIFITACMYLAVPSPVRVRANVSISAIDPTGRIAAGDKHTCAIAVDDTIWCWGDNTYSQLGSSSFVDEFSLTPIQTTSLPGARIAKRIVAGANHTCVLATDGTVWCWGQNGSGNLGIGSFLNQGDPVRADLGGTAVVISAGGSTSCAALSDDSLKCWGKGSTGQIGNGASSPSNGLPVYVSLVPASFTVAHIEIGATHSCAISVAGAAWCWGEFTNGRLGTTASSNAITPTATASLGATASEVAAGGAHTCALLTNGAITCFGNNNTGQLGQALTMTSSSTPTVVTLSATATHVSVGKQFTCALLSTAAVNCFGDDAKGQLGFGTSGSFRETPAAVTGLTGTVVDVVAGTSHACAVMSTGQVRCWGLNDQGQLGIGTQSNVSTATAISTLNVVPTTTVAPTTVAPTTIAPTTVAPTTVAPTTIAPTTVPPTTTVMPTTTVAPTPVALTTIAPSTVSSTTVETTSTTTSTTTTSTTEAPVILALVKAAPKGVSLIRPMAVRRGSNVSAAKLAASVSMAIPKRSVGTMRISITKGNKYCVFVGTSLKAVRPGKCTVVVILLPKRGKSILRSNTLTVGA
jgi:alpha-tubulin suppressor-like RCC1 family protein